MVGFFTAVFVSCTVLRTKSTALCKCNPADIASSSETPLQEVFLADGIENAETAGDLLIIPFERTIDMVQKKRLCTSKPTPLQGQCFIYQACFVQTAYCLHRLEKHEKSGYALQDSRLVPALSHFSVPKYSARCFCLPG